MARAKRDLAAEADAWFTRLSTTRISADAMRAYAAWRTDPGAREAWRQREAQGCIEAPISSPTIH